MSGSHSFYNFRPKEKPSGRADKENLRRLRDHRLDEGNGTGQNLPSREPLHPSPKETFRGSLSLCLPLTTGPSVTTSNKSELSTNAVRVVPVWNPTGDPKAPLVCPFCAGTGVTRVVGHPYSPIKSNYRNGCSFLPRSWTRTDGEDGVYKTVTKDLVMTKGEPG